MSCLNRCKIIHYAWWWWWRDMRKTEMKLMLVSFPSPKCNHNKLPLWGTDTFDLYFFMIHICIYCCAVAHMDNPVPHVWISLNNKDALTAVLSDFFKLLLSVCTVFVSVAFSNTFKHSQTWTYRQQTYIFTRKLRAVKAWSLPWLTVFSCCWDWLAVLRPLPLFILTALLDFAAPQK